MRLVEPGWATRRPNRQHFIDTGHATKLEYSPSTVPTCLPNLEGLVMSLVKIIVITVIVILSILLFGRFFT